MQHQYLDHDITESYLFHLCQLTTGVLIIPQVLFVAHEDYGNIGTEVFHFWSPLLRDVFWTGPRNAS